jgi:hypothetical protein
MHAGTFLGGTWGRGRVFVFGFPGFPAGVSRHPGIQASGHLGIWASGILAVLDVLLRVNVSRNNVSIGC